MKGVKNMKKQYVKPELYFEDFELSTNIATGCGTIVEHADGECTYVQPGIGTVFTTNIAGCEYKNPDDVGVCYNVPEGNNKVFSS